jgi:2-(1,2-epoxy-1,2-dihydrophenyl)acetyl-CoA isomerase
METQETVLTSIHEHVMTITLNRPEKANAFSLAMIAATQKAFREAARDTQVRAVLLTGSGAVFSAGQDLIEIQQAQGTSLRKHLQETYNPLVVQIRRLDKPFWRLSGRRAGLAGAGLRPASAPTMPVSWWICGSKVPIQGCRYSYRR